MIHLLSKNVNMEIISNSPFSATWARRDVEALNASDYEVTVFDGFSKSLILGAFGVLKLVWKKRGKQVIWIHQSAGHASLLPCLLGKTFNHKNIIIAVGTESACFPEIDYGHYRKWSTRLSARVSLNRADLICPVHESMISYDYTYWDVKYKTQGIKAFIPDLKTPFFPIHNGFDRNLWGVDQKWSERKIDVMCVFSLGAKNRSVLKGADLIIAIARRNPSLRFRIIGEAPADFDLPENCEVISNCDQQELRGHYNEAKLFVQASITEGFPNTLCEAMACGCFPIGSRVSSIPSIIANYGLILERREVALLERLIVEALVEVKNGQLTTKAISKSIFERYSIVGRSGKLMEALHQLSKQTERS